MTSSVRNRYRNQIGVGLLLSIVLWVMVIAGLWGTQVMVKQRMEHARQRIVGMRAEMDQLNRQIDSLLLEQGASLNRDALKKRLQEAGSLLVPIATNKVRQLEGTQAVGQGLTMGAPGPAAARRP